MVGPPVDTFMLPRGDDRWAEEYAAHITAVENREFERPFGPTRRMFRSYPFASPPARPHKFRPDDDPGLLDEDFDKD